MRPVDAQLDHLALECVPGDAEQLGRANDVPEEIEGSDAYTSLGRFEVEVFEDELWRGPVRDRPVHHLLVFARIRTATSAATISCSPMRARITATVAGVQVAVVALLGHQAERLQHPVATEMALRTGHYGQSDAKAAEWTLSEAWDQPSPCIAEYALYCFQSL